MHIILDIILIILQVIGWTFLVVLGLVLLVLLIVLLVPIRYRVDASKHEELLVRAKVTYLLRLVCLKVSYNHKLSIVLRIGPFLFYSNDEEWLHKKEEGSAKKQKKKEEQEAKKRQKEQMEQKVTPPNEMASLEALADQTTQVVSKPEGESAEQTNSDNSEFLKSLPDESKVDIFEQTDEASNSKQPLLKRLRTILQAAAYKLRAVIETIRQIPNKIRGILQKIAETLKKGKDGIEELKRKYRLIRKFLANEVHKAAIGHTWRLLKKMLFHLLPYKIRGTVEIGTGDPCSTGQLLGVLSLMYMKSGNGFTIIPDFEEKRYEVEVRLKGRIRLGTLLILLFRVILHKSVRRLFRNVKRLRKALTRPAV